MRNVLLALEPYGITVNQANRMVQVYGDLCLAKVQENPYQLIDDIDGIGFLTADRIAQNVAGFETDSLARLQAGLRYALERVKEERGDMFLPRDELLQHAQKLLGAPTDMLSETIDWMIDGGDLFMQQVGEIDAVFLPYLAKVEDYIAKRLLQSRGSQRNIAEIAFSVGFNDPKYFTRCFTRKFGVSPSGVAGDEKDDIDNSDKTPYSISQDAGSDLEGSAYISEEQNDDE